MYDISRYLAGRGYKVDLTDYRNQINKWLGWYKGKVKEFHQYNVYNGVQWVATTRKSLDMAKTICEDWANLLLNERVEITPENETSAERLSAILDENNFTVRGNRAIERAFATGTGAFSEYIDAEGMPMIDCHDARSIWPLSRQNDEITECAFSSVEIMGGKEIIYLRFYTWSPRGTQQIENVFLEYESGLKLPPPDGVEEFVDTGIPYPLFQIIEPNIANNVDITSPLGISVFANAIDALKAVDLTFDSWCSEYQLGRKRLIVPMSMAQKVSSVTVEGREVEVPLFDPNDTVFYGMDFDDENQKPFDHSPEIRAEQHLAGLTANLALLSIKCGLGANRYSFDRHEGVKTATEVVSEQSDLYQTLCKHELVLTDALKGLARALLALTGIRDVGEIKIKFDDSIIQDKNAIRNEARTDVAAGLMSKKRYLLDVIGMNEAEADAELAQIASESRVSMDAVDLSAFGAGG